MPKELNGRPIAFPDVHDFNDLFTKVEFRAPGDKCTKLKRFTWFDEHSKENPHQTVSGSITVDTPLDGYIFLDATEVAPMVLEYIENAMIRVDYDQIHFRIIVWRDGDALVFAQYNQIIGSRLLAIIRASTIPRPTKVTA